MKMKQMFMLIFFVGLLSSCATSIKVKVTHPPLADMRGVEKIAVIPVELAYKPDGVGSKIVRGVFTLVGLADPHYVSDYQLAKIITQEMLIAINKTGAYTLVDPSLFMHSKLMKEKPLADIYIAGTVNGISTSDSKYKVTVKDRNGDERKEDRFSRTVNVGFSYKFIRADNEEIIYVTSKKATAQEEQTSKDSLSQAASIAYSAIHNEMGKMYRELVPWDSIEELFLANDKMKDKRMKDASKLLEKKGKEGFIGALKLYHDIYNETGNTAAGYNEVIITEALGDIPRAIELMNKLLTKIKKSEDFSKDTKKLIRRSEVKLDMLQKKLSDNKLLKDYE